jgi:hypothetical protein
MEASLPVVMCVADHGVTYGSRGDKATAGAALTGAGLSL